MKSRDLAKSRTPSQFQLLHQGTSTETSPSPPAGPGDDELLQEYYLRDCERRLGERFGTTLQEVVGRAEVSALVAGTGEAEGPFTIPADDPGFTARLNALCAGALGVRRPHELWAGLERYLKE